MLFSKDREYQQYKPNDRELAPATHYYVAKFQQVAPLPGEELLRTGGALLAN